MFRLNMLIDFVSSPILMFFIVALLGMLLGKIKIKNITLGLAGVLGVSLLMGSILGVLNASTVIDFKNTISQLNMSYSFLASLGSALFISVIGINAGTIFIGGNIKRKMRALCGGALIVSIGGLCTAILSFVCSSTPKSLMLGAFAGGMTSTPTLALVSELVGDNSLPAAGYGAAYCPGLLCTVVVTQLLLYKEIIRTEMPEQKQESNHAKKVSCLFGVLFTAIVGTLVGAIIPIGTSGGILLIGIAFGYICNKIGIVFTSSNDIRDMGLIMFLIGKGVPAGIELSNGLDVKIFLVGFLIPVLSVLIGYIVNRKVLRFTNAEAVSVICGGMTSTPAFGVIKQKHTGADSVLYSISYAGALIALVLWVQILNIIMQ